MNKKNWSGSQSRDFFKLQHKQHLGPSLYAFDLDLCLVEKDPFPGIVAAIDYKFGLWDEITFAEVIGYNGLISRGIPVFIVCGDSNLGRFDIHEYRGGHHSKPECNVPWVCSVQSWLEFEQWERELRKSWKRRFSSLEATGSFFR
jgi:hypothetical protein